MLFASVLTSYVSIIYIGVLLIVAGILEMVAAFRVRRVGGPTVMMLLAGLLAVVVGALFLYRPEGGIASLTLLITCYLFASGLFRGVTSIVDRYPGWGWDVAYAIVAILLGAYIVRTWPTSALWVLGTVVGAEIMARGIVMVTASWSLRDVEHRALHAHAA
jgi:uncharacterized membrane protein HdeD (DUF308 family)